MSTPTEDTNVPETPIFDPFPKPVTMPTGWDLSGLVSNPTPATDSSTDDKADTSKE